MPDLGDKSFVRMYDAHFSRYYGFCRPDVQQVIYRYLEAHQSDSPIFARFAVTCQLFE
jgi:hypothetical protein